MNKLLHGMMNRASLIAVNDKEPDPAAAAAQEAAFKKYRPNRAARRAQAKIRDGQRWDKRLAKHYDIPKALRSNASRYGSSVEMMLSELLQQGAIKYKEMSDGNTVPDSDR